VRFRSMGTALPAPAPRSAPSPQKRVAAR
jgi:hypothetical protein